MSDAPIDFAGEKAKRLLPAEQDQSGPGITVKIPFYDVTVIYQTQETPHGRVLNIYADVYGWETKSREGLVPLFKEISLNARNGMALKDAFENAKNDNINDADVREVLAIISVKMLEDYDLKTNIRKTPVYGEYVR